MSRRWLVLAALLLWACGSPLPSVVPATSNPGTPSPIPTTSATPTLAPTAGPIATLAPTAAPTSAPTATLAPAPTASGAPTSSPSAGTIVIRAYFLLADSGGNPGLVPVLRTVPQTQAVAAASMAALVAGPSAAERAASPAIQTTVPTGTRFLGVSITNGLATVNFSHEFEEGGGSLSVRARLAQVVYTLTQFSTVNRVTFQLDGVPVTIFSPEGIILDRPVGRTDYDDELLPAIFVDRPAWGAALPLPGRVTGLANVFEAQFSIALLDRQGSVLVQRAVMATCGTGCWGTFDVSLAYVVSTAQWGTLRVWEDSAQDGQPVHVRSYPIWLLP